MNVFSFCVRLPFFCSAQIHLTKRYFSECLTWIQKTTRSCSLKQVPSVNVERSAFSEVGSGRILTFLSLHVAVSVYRVVEKADKPGGHSSWTQRLKTNRAELQHREETWTPLSPCTESEQLSAPWNSTLRLSNIQKRFSCAAQFKGYTGPPYKSKYCKNVINDSSFVQEMKL